MNRRTFLALGVAGTAVALGRSMVTVPGLWTPGPSTEARIVSIDDPYGIHVGDLIRRADGFVYRVTKVERDNPVGAELASTEPVFTLSKTPRQPRSEEVLAETVLAEIDGAPVAGVTIYRHRFERDGEYFHIGTSRPAKRDDVNGRLETWHPSFWERKRWERPE